MFGRTNFLGLAALVVSTAATPVVAAAHSDAQSSAHAQKQAVATPSFGSRIEFRDDFREPFLTGDLAGNGERDEVFIVRIAPQSARTSIASDVVVESLSSWGKRNLNKNGEPLALAIVHGTSNWKFLIHDGSDNSFFDTDIWRVHPLPLELARRGSNKARGLPLRIRRSKHDVLVLGTEAGIDTFLYFDGTKYVYYEPPEEP